MNHLSRQYSFDIFSRQTVKLNFVFVHQGEEPSIQPIRVQEAVQRNKRSRHMCEPCDKVIIGDLEWTGTLSAGVSLFSHSFIIIHIFHRIFMKPTNSSPRSVSPPAAHLKSKKHQGHMRKKRRSDQSLTAPTAPPAAPEATESLSEAPGGVAARGDALQGSPDGRSSHTEEPVTS